MSKFNLYNKAIRGLYRLLITLFRASSKLNQSAKLFVFDKHSKCTVIIEYEDFDTAIIDICETLGEPISSRVDPNGRKASCWKIYRNIINDDTPHIYFHHEEHDECRDGELFILEENGFANNCIMWCGD